MKTPITFYPVNLEGLKDKYLISKEGLVLSLQVQRLLNPHLETNGYWYLSIRYKNSNSYPLHRLLANTFIPNPNNLPEVNHKDGNKLNNSLDNLEWVTGSNNIRHAFTNNLTKYKALIDYNDIDSIINKLLTDESSNLCSLSRELGISGKSGSLYRLIERHLIRENNIDLLNQIKTTIFKRKGQATAKKIIAKDVATEEELEFKSLREAADYYGISHANVCRCCKSGRESRGIIFRYA